MVNALSIAPMCSRENTDHIPRGLPGGDITVGLPSVTYDRRAYVRFGLRRPTVQGLRISDGHTRRLKSEGISIGQILKRLRLERRDRPRLVKPDVIAILVQQICIEIVDGEF